MASSTSARPRLRLFGSYADILIVPGAWQFTLAGWLGRFTRSTGSIATILLVSAQTGSFTLAGAVAGTIVLGIAIGGPVWSRAADARGQARVLPLSLGATVLAAAALAVTIVFGAPVWSWFVCALALGASTVDMGSLVRARWRGVLASGEARHTSLSLEAVNDELVFVVGPPAVTLIATSAGAFAGLAAGVAVTVVGGVWLWLQRATMPQVVGRLKVAGAASVAQSHPGHPGRARPRRARFRLPAGVLGLLPVYLGVGGVFASIDVGAISVATDTGQPWLAGVILAVFATGSVVAGFAFGPLSARWAPASRVLIASVAYACVVPCLLLLQTPVALASIVFIAGLVTTPVLISGTALIAGLVEDARLTEALTWPSIGLSVGVTIGGAVTGVAIDHGTGFSAFGVSAGAAVVVGVFGVLCALLERRRAD
ncbi:MFS transporter [Subtercola sp. Z020]|uniref:MFS transporter n=1 Tax=Subtercola sp. Z020 TaxID=2080582 RepID=UPI000CE85864|nr:MFS transporter [Subtercola sp. Z020]PPF79746.1 MFS transporter [Subtercola sp. Z020]